MDEDVLLERARAGDEGAFERLVLAYRGELAAHCYRMLGSPHDAEDAVQETLLNAWRGLAGFEGRSSLRTWLYRISTNTCLRLSGKRGPRVMSPDRGPALGRTDDLGTFVGGPVWMEPWPDDLVSDEPGPAASYLRREGVELAFVAALQRLPGTQRAVLILREVLGFSAAEVAGLLDTSVASVNSALQRAGRTMRAPATTQREELGALGAGGRGELVALFMAAWERADVDGLVALLADDARFTMPPLPAWFDGREDVRRFLVERVFAFEWRLRPIGANGQLGFACYQRTPGGQVFLLAAIIVLSLRDGKIVEIAGFLDAQLHDVFGLSPEISPEER
ncbi:sigma-70 family RNA polymerase sigma factor [Nonomuraea endophytica]|uniref:RNA polymerase sigma-70 factor (ECF subfamily) n=1 Tax=Nonomuraea endophytica TaxID=714136 RepID=A0A7W8ELB2_9ACTN|nr:sigma-70 family RNA polymerase sigma factor [Nonomuraea endophytica]MBB5083709.1 RNA polymerase sigma-70 factor (ECF subfamily) [Nonomuraea endophytica]